MHKDYLYIVCSQVLIHKDEWSAPMQSDKTSPRFDTTWQGSNPSSLSRGWSSSHCATALLQLLMYINNNMVGEFE